MEEIKSGMLNGSPLSIEFKGTRSRNFWAISGNFSTDQIVIESTKISK